MPDPHAAPFHRLAPAGSDRTAGMATGVFGDRDAACLSHGCRGMIGTGLFGRLGDDPPLPIRRLR